MSLPDEFPPPPLFPESVVGSFVPGSVFCSLAVPLLFELSSVIPYSSFNFCHSLYFLLESLYAQLSGLSFAKSLASMYSDSAVANSLACFSVAPRSLYLSTSSLYSVLTVSSISVYVSSANSEIALVVTFAPVCAVLHFAISAEAKSLAS